MRDRLPERRAHELLAMSFRGRDYTVGIGRFRDGRLAEVFIDTAKAGTDAADDARDAAITLSFALQNGADAESIRSAVTRDASGRPAGIIGAVLDLLAEGRP